MNKRELIEEGVLSIIETQSKSSNIVAPETTLYDLKVNSIIFIKIIVDLETKFNIEFEDEKLLMSEFPTVKDFIDYIYDAIEK